MYALIYATAQSEDDARKIAQVLIKENLAACVNFWKIKSIYRWKGKIQEDGEVAMFIKTREDIYQSVIGKIKEMHPYDVPEIIRLDIKDGFEKYLSWNDEETGKG